MRTRIVSVLLCGAVCLLAVFLRFYRLEAWPFHSDELWTFAETDSLLHPAPEVSSQIDRLPRAIPLSHLVHAAGYHWFGRDEGGSRRLVALMGSASILATLIGLLLARQGLAVALTASLLLTLWPQHVYYSQENRFYMTTFCFASLVMLLGAIAVERRSLAWMTAAAIVGLLALFVHTLLLLLLPGLLAATLLLAWTERDGRLFRQAVVAGLALLVGCAIYLGYTRPLLAGWNSTETWSYSPLKSLLASVFKLGWPVALLACLGAVVALVQWNPADRYWLIWGGLWLVGCLALPLLMRHHPAYSFPLTLGVLVLASRGVCHVATRLAGDPIGGGLAIRPTGGVVLAFSWVLFACTLNLPSLASHFLDGSCSNYREAAHYVRDHWQPEDRVLATSPDLLRYYLADRGQEHLPEIAAPGWLELYETATSLQQLEQHLQQPGRLWIVVNYGRANRPIGLLDWLGKHATRQLDLSVVRLDAFEYSTTVYVVQGEEGSLSSPATRHLPPVTQEGRKSE